ncbi:hypothetical protein C8J57DRAFT_1466784 [Mycena rebaudengoi]|nr:hypothetical protein C8J57DRAFT_1466784 [Mycena rebaudengoi]
MADLVEILRSNYAPPEFSSLRAVIASSPAELARYDMEIVRVQGILAELQTARASTQSHYNTCRGLVSALRRLPTEILVEIFALIPPDVPTPRRPGVDLREEIEEETKSVAKVHLLRLAGVCSRWHGLVMDTPALWSNISLGAWYCEYIHGGSWRHSADQERMLGLLNSVLDRGANSPLTLHVRYGATPKPLALLVQHSRRWRRMTLEIMAHSVWNFSAVKGHLPLLEALTIHGDSLNASGPALLDLFRDAPRLTSLTFYGAVKALSTFSAMKQLRHFSLHVQLAKQLSAALSFANNLSRSARFVLGIDARDVDLPLGLKPVVAHIQALVLNFADDDMAHASEILKEIFDNLTLDVQELSIISHFFVGWPHLQSLAFFSRSSSSRSLKVLEIPYVVITEEALLQCLGELPALEKLVVSDHSLIYHNFHHHLITDSLLRRLTWTPDSSCLVPHLNFLSCRTILDFHHDVFLDFVLSSQEERPTRRSTLTWYSMMNARASAN